MVDDPRSTYQTQALIEIQESAEVLERYVQRFAGKNKTDAVLQQPPVYVRRIEKYIQTMVRAKRITFQCYEQWTAFKEVFGYGSNGTGSWTRSLPFLRNFVELVLQAK